MDSCAAACTFDDRAELGKSQLRVVARANRFDDGRHTLREEPGEKDRRFYLCARDGERVYSIGDRGVPSIVSGARPPSRASIRAPIFAERIDHAAHRTESQRGVAIKG